MVLEFSKTFGFLFACLQKHGTKLEEVGQTPAPSELEVNSVFQKGSSVVTLVGALCALSVKVWKLTTTGVFYVCCGAELSMTGSFCV